MAEKDSTKAPVETVSDSQRYHYIGFEVFPGEPKELFRSEEEKKRLVDHVVEKRESGDLLRDDCQLLADRISLVDRLALTLASVMMLVSLFLPWYSFYNETIEQVTAKPSTAATSVAENSVAPVQQDSLAAAATATEGAKSDPTTITNQESPAQSPGEEAAVPATETTSGIEGVSGTPVSTDAGFGEEVITTGLSHRTKVSRDSVRESGLSGLLAIGSVGSYVFSSGIILVVTGALLIVYSLTCLILPIVLLVGLFGGKGTSDEHALKMKKLLRLNWLPVVALFLIVFLSVIGASYGFEPSAQFDSLGDQYGIGVLLTTLSWGLFLSLAGFVMAALKGVEI